MNYEPKLIVDGEVVSPHGFTRHELLELPDEQQVADMTRIDPNRPGRAVRLAAVLDLVRPTEAGTHLTLHASADDFHASIPLAAVRDRGLIIYENDSLPLPASAGGPFRFYVENFAECHSHDVDECANVKFVDHIEITAGPGRDNRPKDDAEHAKLHEG